MSAPFLPAPPAGQCLLFELSPAVGGCALTAQGLRPDLTAYDVILLSLSGGKDSQLTARLVAEAARTAGVLGRVVAVHAYLQEDWPDAHEYARMHAAAYGVERFEVVRAGESLLAHVRRRGKWPSAAVRWCTSDHKRAPISALMTVLADEIDPRALGRPVRILNTMGLRAAESSGRAKRPAHGHNRRESNKTRRHVDNWLPIHDLSTLEVQAALDSGDVPHHPHYDSEAGPWTGLTRLSCRLCVLASMQDLTRSVELDPEWALEYVEVEQVTGHDFRHGMPISEILRIAADRAAARHAKERAEAGSNGQI